MHQATELSGRIIGAAMHVHTSLGPGLLERAYHVCLAYELRKRGMNVRTEVPITIVYDGVELDLAYRMDILVEESVAVEVKAMERLQSVHRAQVLSQLRVANLNLGLLINFHALHLRDGVQRIINGR